MSRTAQTRLPHRAALLLVALVLAGALSAVGAEARAAGEPPLTPTVTFGAPREWQVRPHTIDMGDSACSPRFSALRWTSYGSTGGRAVGKGIFPHVHPFPDSCDAAFYRARPKRVRIVVARPLYCYGQYMFTRIGWRAHGERAHYVTPCD